MSPRDARQVRPQGEARATGADGVSARMPARRAQRAIAYPFKQPFTWWMRRRGYLLYMLREFTPAGIVAWMVLFLVEIARARQGAAEYEPLGGPLIVGISIVCLALALWHSYTFLSLAGMIMRIPLGDGTVSPRLIARAMFGLLAVVTALIAGLLIWGGL